MMIVKKNEVKKIRSIWGKYGIDTKLKFSLLKDGIKYYAVPNTLDISLMRKLNTKGLGLLIGWLDGKEDFVFTVEGAQLIGKYSKNKYELNEEEMYYWIRGQNFKVNLKDGYYLIKYKDDILGWGKVRSGVMINTIPKERRVFRL